MCALLQVSGPKLAIVSVHDIMTHLQGAVIACERWVRQAERVGRAETHRRSPIVVRCHEREACACCISVCAAGHNTLITQQAHYEGEVEGEAFDRGGFDGGGGRRHVSLCAQVERRKRPSTFFFLYMYISFFYM